MLCRPVCEVSSGRYRAAYGLRNPWPGHNFRVNLAAIEVPVNAVSLLLRLAERRVSTVSDRWESTVLRWFQIDPQRFGQAFESASIRVFGKVFK